MTALFITPKCPPCLAHAGPRDSFQKRRRFCARAEDLVRTGYIAGKSPLPDPASLLREENAEVDTDDFT